MVMTRRPSNIASLFLLLPLALAGFGVACGMDPPPPEGGGSETATADSSGSTSGSAGASFTSVVDVSGTSTDPSASTSSSGSIDSGEVFLSAPDWGCGMVLSPEGFAPRCTFECEVAVPGQCERGYKCVSWANDGGTEWNATRCAPVAEDPAGVGEPCVAEQSPFSGVDTCDASSMCFGVDPRTLQGTCAPLCNPEAGVSCADDEVCAMYINDFEPHVCMPRCDPLDPAACAAGESCRLIEDFPLCIPDVVPLQDAPCGANGQYCAQDEVCQTAEVLASCDDEACCRPWCDLSAPDPDLPCAAVPGDVCRAVYDPPLPGLEHVGACGLPF